MILKSLFIVTLTINLTYGKYSPVLIWDSSSPAVPIFEKISSIDFMKSIISDNVYESMVITFIDDSADVKDFSKCKLSSGDKCFNNLSQMKNKVFYANVKDPIDALRNSDLKKQYTEINENGELTESIDFERGKIVFITFTKSLNDEENKSKILHKRDSIIHKIYKELSSEGKTIGIYIGKQEDDKLKRTIRQVSNEKQEQNNGFVFNVDNKFVIYYKNLSYQNEKESTKHNIKILSAGIENITVNGFNIKLNGENNTNIMFRVDMGSGYWHVNNLYFQNTLLKSESIMSAAEKFSYYCGDQQMTDNENKITLYWNHLQMEPNFNQTTNENSNSFKFDDPWNCVGFTSIGIWSGLFVTFMMLGILSIGITWLMDIRTMDRFDDPKGKTITITASD